MLVEGIAAAAAAVSAYSFLYDPYKLVLTEIEFGFPNLPAEFDGFTILQISDMHLKKENWIQTTAQNILQAKLRRLIRGRHYDMVAFTGDAEVRGEEGFRSMKALLDAVPSRYGSYFVPGNGEYQHHYDIDHFLDTVASWGMKLLRNASCVIEKDGAHIDLIGVDDQFTRHSDLPAALTGVPDGGFRLLLSHSPAIAREAIKHNIDLVLSGHTHGGQVRMPFVGALYTHLGVGAPRLDAGVFQGRRLAKRTGMDPKGTKVFVARGVGMSDFYIRFLCPPEVGLITLRRMP